MGGVVHHQPAEIELGDHVRKLGLIGGDIARWLAELQAPFQMMGGVADALAHQPEDRRRIEDPLYVEPTHHDLPSLPLLPQAVEGRDSGIVEG
jgi:hypothetical protein